MPRDPVKKLARLLLACSVLTACAPSATHAPARPEGTRVRIGVLETTDLHSHVLSYDYYKLAPDPSIGLERAATLIAEARREFPNTLLFDDGDTLQGSPLADYQALVARPTCDTELAVYRAMDTLGYDAGTIGNHEFNYGLPYLSQVTGTPFDVAGIAPRRCVGPHFPLVLSNVFDANTGQPLYAPWRVLDRTLHARTPDGRDLIVPIRIGLLGLTPPPIVQWDKRNLEGKVTVMGAVEAARRYLPELRRAGADLIIALLHGGLDAAPYSPQMENPGWHLAAVPGIDVLLLGHSHDVFPNPRDAQSRFAHLPEVDVRHGTVRGVPAVMGDYFGKGIGLIDLALVWREGRWQVDRTATRSEFRPLPPGEQGFTPDSAIARAVATEHAATIAWMQTPIGSSDFALSTYFVAAGDTSALTIVNHAQRDYVERYLRENRPELAGIPVLSAAAPFKAGFGGPRDYTDVPAGPLTIRNAADLYLYPNTLTVVRTNGAGVKAWLEKAAGWFHRIDPGRSEPQQLINRRFPSYNFDVIQGGLRYVIDPTQAEGSRIVDLRYADQPVRPEQPFLVVTNNYRASGGGNFPGLDGSNIVLSAPDTNREVLIGFIRATSHLTRARFGDERNWQFARVHTAGPILFTSAAGKLELARAAGLSSVSLWKDLGDGNALYRVDLDR
jgi:2',3'-cyclic-nucleotide 2'-phosphodiesterase/3'-nucleotidase